MTSNVVCILTWQLFYMYVLLCMSGVLEHTMIEHAKHLSEIIKRIFIKDISNLLSEILELMNRTLGIHDMRSSGDGQEGLFD